MYYRYSSRHLYIFFVTAFLGIIKTSPLYATENRFYFVSLNDFSAKRGFYADLENQADGNGVCTLSTAKFILGVADGKEWRFDIKTYPFQYDRDYKVDLMISPVISSTSVDGEKVNVCPFRFASSNNRMEIGSIPGFASGVTDYRVTMSQVSITCNNNKPQLIKIPGAKIENPLLHTLTPQTPVTIDNWNYPGKSIIQIRFILRFTHNTPINISEYTPIFDRYGQLRYVEWPDKIRSDADLRKGDAEEERRLLKWGKPAGFTTYGGCKTLGWKEKASGFYTTSKRNGYWWLIDPEGYPTFYIGMCSVDDSIWERTPISGRESLFEWLPPHTPEYTLYYGKGVWGDNGDIEYVNFYGLNMYAHYGSSWQEKLNILSRRRIRAWGFSGLSKWSSEKRRMPYFPVLPTWALPKLVKHIDVWNKDSLEKLQTVFIDNIRPHINNPNVVGWSVGNEYDEIITRDEVLTILTMKRGVPARDELVSYALHKIYNGDEQNIAKAWGVTNPTMDSSQAKPSAEDIETLRRYYEASYYDVLYRAVKKIDPNHLYFGSWIVPKWWENEEDWYIQARYTDVIGYDQYHYQFNGNDLDRLLKNADKPAFCGEFSFPPVYNFERGFGLYQVWAIDDADAGNKYTQWVIDSARNPYCVGVSWFQYRDQPISGRGPGSGSEPFIGEHYAFGAIDIANHPKWELIEKMRAINLKAAKIRGKAAIAANRSVR